MKQAIKESFGSNEQAVCIKTTGAHTLLDIYEIEYFGDSRAVVVHTDEHTVRVFDRRDFDEHFKVLDSGEGRG